MMEDKQSKHVQLTEEYPPPTESSCFINGEWWDDLDSFLEQTGQVLVPRNSERLKLDRSLYINVGNYEENIHRFKEPTTSPPQPKRRRMGVVPEKREATNVEEVEMTQDLGENEFRSGDHIFVKGTRFTWLKLPPPLPTPWTPPTGTIGSIFNAIKAELVTNYNWNGVDEDMKGSQEFIQLLEDMHDYDRCGENLAEYDLADPKGRRIYVYSTGTQLRYVFEVPIEQDPKVGDEQPQEFKLDVKLNSQKLCVTFICWKLCTTTTNCEEHGPRNQEFLILHDIINNNECIITSVQPAPRSDRFDQDKISQYMNGHRIWEHHSSTSNYMKSRGLTEPSKKPDRMKDYKSQHRTSAQIQRLEDEWIAARLQLVNFQIHHEWQWSVPYIHKDLYNMITNTVNLALSYMVASHNTLYPKEKSIRLANTEIIVELVDFQLLDQILQDNGFRITTHEGSKFGELTVSPFRPNNTKVDPLWPSTYMLLYWPGEIYHGEVSTPTNLLQIKTSGRYALQYIKGRQKFDYDKMKNSYEMFQYPRTIQELELTKKATKKLIQTNTSEVHTAIREKMAKQSKRVETLAIYATLFGQLRGEEIDGQPAKSWNSLFSHFNHYTVTQFQLLDDMYDFMFKKRLIRNHHPIQCDINGRPIFDLSCIQTYLDSMLDN